MYRTVLAAMLCSVALSPVAASADDARPDRAALSEVVDQIRMPIETFTLANGLRVVVQTDHKVPTVSISMWYDVGSADEPKGKTGFAHLFEHLMFNGSEHSPGDWFEPMQDIGATELNGTTSYDVTNYFETVPTGALERALFLESDRMGYLLAGVTQAKLDNQRGVVQNEMRQGDNRPMGLVEYVVAAGLFPPGHPYAHRPIGSMADLNAASLEDVRAWFRDHYAPNNAVLVLAGDIDAARARVLVNRYFGALKPSPVPKALTPAVPTLAARTERVIHDDVASPVLKRSWATPGGDHPDSVPLAIGAAALGGLASSRLDDILVRKEKLATSVSAGMTPYARAGRFDVTVVQRPGVDSALLARRLDEVIARLVAEGPTEDEIRRVAYGEINQATRNLEKASDRATSLAQGLLVSNDVDDYRHRLAAYTTADRPTVRAALQRWLTRPAFALTILPGRREPLERVAVPSRFAAGNGAVPRADISGMDRRRMVAAAASPRHEAAIADVDRSRLPPIEELKTIDFPPVVRGKLSNGIGIEYVQRSGLPLTLMTVAFDAGTAADRRDKPGTAALTTALLTEGTRTLSSSDIAEKQEDLGLILGTRDRLDRTLVTMGVLSTNLRPALDLFADIVRNPAFAPTEVERIRVIQLAQIEQKSKEPGEVAKRLAATTLYGPRHPYGTPPAGTLAGTRSITRDDLAQYHDRWIQPGTARIYIASDRPFDEVRRDLDRAFGDWRAKVPAGRKAFDAAIPRPAPRILFVDRKDSPQSYIFGGEVLSAKGTGDSFDLYSANDVLGGDFLSRINMDLREDKGWSYGAGSSISPRADRLLFGIAMPVQADKTGPAIKAAQEQLARFLTTDGVSAAELKRTVTGSIRQLPGLYVTGEGIVQGLIANDTYRRPDNYQQTLPARYRAQTAKALDAAARSAIDPKALTWFVVGDGSTVLPQLKALGLPVTIVPAE